MNKSIEITKRGAKGYNFAWSLQRTTNRIKATCKRAKKIMHKRDLAEDDKCECGLILDDKRVFKLMHFNGVRSAEDVNEMNGNVFQLAEYWDGQI